MKTQQLAWTIYRLRLWSGLATVLLLALAELWMGLHFCMDASVLVGQRLPGSAIELCDLIR
jgi:hypothetical protein